MREFFSAIENFKRKGQAGLLSELGRKRFQLKSERRPIDEPPNPFPLLQCQKLPLGIEAQIAAPFADRGISVDGNAQMAEMPFEAPVRVFGALHRSLERKSIFSAGKFPSNRKRDGSQIGKMFEDGK